MAKQAKVELPKVGDIYLQKGQSYGWLIETADVNNSLLDMHKVTFTDDGEVKVMSGLFSIGCVHWDSLFGAIREGTLVKR